MKFKNNKEAKKYVMQMKKELVKEIEKLSRLIKLEQILERRNQEPQNMAK